MSAGNSSGVSYIAFDLRICRSDLEAYIENRRPAIEPVNDLLVKIYRNIVQLFSYMIHFISSNIIYSAHV